jgi:ABC-type transport system involved in multi-copper enzyme maturation permease subunit
MNTSTLQVCRALAAIALLETVRRRELYVLLVLMALMVVGAQSFTWFGVSGLEVFVKDMAFTCVGVFSTIIGVTVAARQLPEEIQRRTIYPMLARPISRWQLLIGKFAAAWAQTVISFLTLAVVAVFLLLILRIGVQAIFWQYLLLKCAAFLWLCSFTIFLSTIMSHGAAVTTGLLLAFGSGAFSRAFTMLGGTGTPMDLAANLYFGFLPQYTLFDLTKKLVYDWDPIPAVVLPALAAYGVLISAFWLRMAWMRIRSMPL